MICNLSSKALLPLSLLHAAFSWDLTSQQMITQSHLLRLTQIWTGVRTTRTTTFSHTLSLMASLARAGREVRTRGTNYSYRNIRLYGPDKLFRSKPETRTRLSGNAWEPYALPNREFGEGWEVRRKIENNYYRNIRLHGPGIPGESAVRIIKPICLLFRVLNLLRSVVSYY